ncbi:MAG: hypothetical protein OFPI_10680 [Osedax symbiont Rs2]|nr:MAG: hypothetical protein OFPI_10680 [Osedax symbiont Rs2]
MNPFHIAITFAFTALYSMSAGASDFAALGVVIGGGLITMVNISLSIWACTVAKKKGHTKAIPILGVIAVLMFIGIRMINGEADHLSDGDSSGMINIILWPGILSLLVPFFIRKRDLK